MEIYYDHSERRISNDSGDTLTYDEAIELLDSGQVSDYNIAFSTLKMFYGNMELVEKYYREIDG